jgi:hypothetical protein
MKTPITSTLLALLICTLLSNTLLAQKSGKSSNSGSGSGSAFNIGGYVGHLSSNLNQIPFETNGLGGISLEPISSLAIGGTVQYDFAKYFALESGLHYFQQGTKIKTVFTDFSTVFTTEADLKASYISVPVLLQGKVKFGNWEARLGFGGYYSFKLNESQTFTSNDPSITSDGEDNYKGGDFGLQTMVGIGYGFGKSRISLNWRYNAGLSEVLEGIDTQAGDKQAKFTSKNIGISYTYTLGK